MEQRSAEWHEFRRERIGGSEAAALCNRSKYQTAHDLFLIKTGQKNAPDLSDNFAVQRGVRLESHIKGRCEVLLDLDFFPQVFSAPGRDYMSASFDGLSRCKQVLEIKVTNKADFATGIVPPQYFPQVQHQMFVADTNQGFIALYLVTRGEDETLGKLKIIPFLRDEEFLKQYIERVDLFYHCMKEKRWDETLMMKI